MLGFVEPNSDLTAKNCTTRAFYHKKTETDNELYIHDLHKFCMRSLSKQNPISFLTHFFAQKVFKYDSTFCTFFCSFIKKNFLTIKEYKDF